MTVIHHSFEQTGSVRLDEALRQLVRDYSIEIVPKSAARIESFAERLPRGTNVYIPFLSGAAMGETVSLAERLVAEGMRPVPHISARATESRVQLAGWLARLEAAGVDSLLLIAGDVASPRGPFSSTLDVLETGLLARHGFRRIGMAGHPEGHPKVDAGTLDNAIRAKTAYAQATKSELWLVTQFAFESGPVVDWLRRMKEDGVGLRVRIGVPGPARMRTLIAYALHCGVGASARALARRPDAATMMLGRWVPDELLLGLARYMREDRDALVDGIHVFPFGGLDAAVARVGAIAQGTLFPDETGETLIETGDASAATAS